MAAFTAIANQSPMSDFLSNWSIDQLESWRAVCNLSLLFSTLAVAMGVYFEREGNPDAVKKYGWLLVVKGVAAEFFFAAALWQIDSAISTIQKTEIANANRATEDVRQENLKLQAKVIWRQLSVAQCKTLTGNLAPPQSTVLIEYPIGDPEALTYAITFGNCFGKFSTWHPAMQGLLVADAVPQGLNVAGASDAAVATLKSALGAINLPFGSDPETAEKAAAARYGPADILPDVRLLVGSKPIFGIEPSVRQ